jgi:long-chain acyl-CoA synthetase
MACGLHQAGLRRGEHMVIVGANRPRLYATMLAAQSLGAIPVPLYQDAVAAECVFPINNAEVRFAWWKTRSRSTRCWSARASCPQLSHIYFDDPRGCATTTKTAWPALDELMAAGKAFSKRASRLFPER